MILAIDVGKGTEDILLQTDPSQPKENAIQVVVPSTAQLLKHKLETDNSEKILIQGELMAGEPWHKVVYEKSKRRPNSVIMTKTAARSIRYNLEQVKSKNVKIISDESAEVYADKLTTFKTRDVDWDRIKSILTHSGVDISDISKVLLSCQDHGEPEDPWHSTRDFRMKTIYKNLEVNNQLEDLMLKADTIPSNLPRFQSISNSAKNYFDHLTYDDIYVMDSSPAVILGAMKRKQKEIAINVGNGHTLAVFLTRGRVDAIYETHTGGVKPENLLEILQKIIRNNITHEEILDAGGHGLFKTKHLNVKSFSDYGKLTVIGPNRNKLQSLNVDFVHPIGNMMMAGPIGLIAAYNKILHTS